VHVLEDMQEEAAERIDAYNFSLLSWSSSHATSVVPGIYFLQGLLARDRLLVTELPHAFEAFHVVVAVLIEPPCLLVVVVLPRSDRKIVTHALHCFSVANFAAVVFSRYN
jgi:hypothetical protein